MKKHTAIRIDEQDLAMIAKLGINLPELVRQALKQEIAKRSKRCPTCGQAISTKETK